ncbi:response regulator [Thermodesulfobacteriota bacterium]
MTEEDLLEGKKILIADDEPDVLDTLEELLEMCETSRAGSFDEAKDLMENRHFDIAILDIMGVDGFKLLDIANEHKIIAVMLTAHAFSPENTIKSFKKGAAYFVPKEKIVELTIYLNDILGAAQKGKGFWSTWMDRLSEYYTEKYGNTWMEKDRDFWEKL